MHTLVFIFFYLFIFLTSCRCHLEINYYIIPVVKCCTLAFKHKWSCWEQCTKQERKQERELGSVNERARELKPERVDSVKSQIRELVAMGVWATQHSLQAFILVCARMCVYIVEASVNMCCVSVLSQVDSLMEANANKFQCQSLLHSVI